MISNLFPNPQTQAPVLELAGVGTGDPGEDPRIPESDPKMLT